MSSFTPPPVNTYEMDLEISTHFISEQNATLPPVLDYA